MEGRQDGRRARCTGRLEEHVVVRLASTSQVWGTKARQVSLQLAKDESKTRQMSWQASTAVALSDYSVPGGRSRAERAERAERAAGQPRAVMWRLLSIEAISACCSVKRDA